MHRCSNKRECNFMYMGNEEFLKTTISISDKNSQCFFEKTKLNTKEGDTLEKMICSLATQREK